MSKTMIIDGINCEFENERNVLEVARNNGIDIPSLCYCENLSIYGGCRLCVVENEKGGIDAACSMKPRQDLVVYTNTLKVRESRKNTLELLLASHNRECTTCKKSGKCKLQEYSRRYNVNEVSYKENTFSKKDIDNSSKCIVRDPSKCILCGLCVRMCSEIQNINAIDFTKRGKKTYISCGYDLPLSSSKCVGCGQCAAVCPTGALLIKDDTKTLWNKLIKKDKKVVVQVAPSVRVGMAEEFSMEDGSLIKGKLYTALRRLGADVIYDTNLTADLTIMEETAEFLERIKNNEKMPMFTSCCPGWINHVEKSHPELMKQVSTCGSPMAMMGSLIRREFKDEDVFSVAVMPCTAKKHEGAREELVKDGKNLIDLVITTSELCEMIKEAGIDFKNLPDSEADNPLGAYTGAGTIFGVTGGVTEAVIRRVLDDSSESTLRKISECGVRGLQGTKIFEVEAGDLKLRIGVVSGLKNADELIAKIESGEEKLDFVEVMACPNGCIGGGGQPYVNNKIKEKRFNSLFEDDNNCKQRLPQDNPQLDYIYNELLNNNPHHYLHIEYPLHKK